MSNPTTPEEARKKLKEMGIDPDPWQSMGGRSARPKAFVRIAGSLQKVTALLEASVRQKQDEVGMLQEKLARIKQGGGH